MLFYVSKIVWGFFQPSAFVGVLITCGAICAVFGRVRLGYRLVSLAGILYLIFGFSPLGNILLVPLELSAVKSPASEIAGSAGIIVLGGAVTAVSVDGVDAPGLTEAAERMTEAVRLALLYPDKPLIFSGGGSSLDARPELTEAELARQFFDGFGIKPPRLVLEDRSRNTLENATFTARLLKPANAQKWVLVTSAFHMMRARGLFEAKGFRIVPWPVDFRTSGEQDRWRPFPQASEGLRRVDLAAKEWTGLWVAKLRGDIS